MSSVTERIGEVHQPKGGYIRPSQFKRIRFEDDTKLNAEENIHASIVGMAVDYLTRFLLGVDIKQAFKISLIGAECANYILHKNKKTEAQGYLTHIKGLDDESIINACKITTFDVWYRSPKDAKLAKGADETNPDKETIENIKIMVQRGIAFFKKYGPIIAEGFSFETDGYTKTVDAGDGDFLTADTLWDFKVSKNKLTSKQTLQLLMYWIMGQHSKKPEFKNITKLGIFNPRLNVAYILHISEVSKEIITMVEKEVICY